MKKQYLFIFIFLITYNMWGQNPWDQIYLTTTLSPDNYQNLQGYVEVAPDNSIYVLESEAVVNTFGGTVFLKLKKFNGTGWDQIGQNLLRNVENNESHIDFIITPSGEIYLGMKDTIAKFNTTTNMWESTTIPEYYGGLCSDDSGTIYFIHRVDGSSGAANSDLSLAKFDNGEVTIEGTLATNILMTPRKVNASNKIIIKNDTFYISTVRQSTNQLYVFKGNPTEGFQKLEQSAPNNGSTLFTGLGLSSMVVSATGEIIISYRPATGNGLSMVTHNEANDTWVPFTTTGINATFSSHNLLRYDNNNTLYLIYQGGNNTGFLFKYNGTSWEHIGPLSFWSYVTINALVRPHIAFSASNEIIFSTGFGTSGFPFLVFRENESLNLLNINDKKQFSLYPNPTAGNFTIDLGATYDNAHITITDLLGRKIMSTTHTQGQQVNLSIDEPAGIYFITIQTADNNSVIRLVKKE
jgi:hypothetical protein